MFSLNSCPSFDLGELLNTFQQYLLEHCFLKLNSSKTHSLTNTNTSNIILPHPFSEPHLAVLPRNRVFDLCLTGSFKTRELFDPGGAAGLKAPKALRYTLLVGFFLWKGWNHVSFDGFFECQPREYSLRKGWLYPISHVVTRDWTWLSSKSEIWWCFFHWTWASASFEHKKASYKFSLEICTCCGQFCRKFCDIPKHEGMQKAPSIARLNSLLASFDVVSGSCNCP